MFKLPIFFGDIAREYVSRETFCRKVFGIVCGCFYVLPSRYLHLTGVERAPASA